MLVNVPLPEPQPVCLSDVVRSVVRARYIACQHSRECAACPPIAPAISRRNLHLLDFARVVARFLEPVLTCFSEYSYMHVCVHRIDLHSTHWQCCVLTWCAAAPSHVKVPVTAHALASFQGQYFDHSAFALQTNKPCWRSCHQMARHG